MQQGRHSNDIYRHETFQALILLRRREPLKDTETSQKITEGLIILNLCEIAYLDLMTYITHKISYY